MSTIQSVAPRMDVLEKAWAAHAEQSYYQNPPEPRDYMYASARRRCLRRAVLEATHPEWIPHFDADTKARLLRGNDRERDITIDLNRVGRLAEPAFIVIGQQERIAIQDRKGRTVIKGKIDGKIRWVTGERWPFETKSWSPFLMERIHTFTDLFENVWTASGAYQLLSYLYATNEPQGLLIIDRPGLPRLIQVNLEEHLDAMELFLADATRAVDHIQAGTLPDFTTEIEECKRCPLFGSACQPPLAHPGAQIIIDESWIQKLERWHATTEAGEEHEALGRAIKKKFRGIDMAIAGGFLLEGQWQKATKYDVPDETQARIDAMLQPYARVEPKGKFFLTVTKI
jgi:hypothetical protein